MGIDTRFFGPSGWQLFHLIAFRSPHPAEVLLMMKDVLPCKFCRKSTTEFVKKHPLGEDAGKWLYEIHNMVNDKLRTQCKDDKNVTDPGVDPSFEEVKDRYMSMKPTEIPGRDFLFSVASNYPSNPDESDMARQRMFMEKLAEAYPFEKFRSVFKKYLNKYPVALKSRKSYMKWMYGLLYELGSAIKIEIPSYRGYSQRVLYYTSGCESKKYKGKTCRRINGGFTKERDSKRTQRITRAGMLT